MSLQACAEARYDIELTSLSSFLSNTQIATKVAKTEPVKTITKPIGGKNNGVTRTVLKVKPVSWVCEKNGRDACLSPSSVWALCSCLWRCSAAPAGPALLVSCSVYRSALSYPYSHRWVRPSVEPGAIHAGGDAQDEQAPDPQVRQDQAARVHHARHGADPCGWPLPRPRKLEIKDEKL